jgi:hypothetical protein
MIKKDLFNSINPRPGYAPAAAVTDNTVISTAGENNAGYESLVYVIGAGSLADADATFAVSMYESTTGAFGGEETAVAATDLLGDLATASFTFADDGKAKKIGYRGNKQWTQLRITPSNNTGNAFFSIHPILGHPILGPTPNPPV